MSSADAIKCYRERVDHFVDLIAQNPDDDAQTTSLADALVTEAAFLADEGGQAYLRYVANLDTAAAQAQADLDQGADEEEGFPIPVLLSGGLKQCYLCERKFTSPTYDVVVELGPGRFLKVCRRCATADPDFLHWQEFCDIADMIDVLMKAAPDKRVRDLLSQLIAQCADHFSAWRWDEDGNPLPPLDEA